jgi:glutamate racemase
MMSELDAAAPIGVFDSGIGGLSVLTQIRRLLPAESLLYVADSGHLPYGNKPADYVIARSLAIARFLAERRAKALVVACNTATAVAVAELRRQFALPVIGVEPGLKPGISRSRGGVVGVLATAGTLGSEKFRRLISTHGQQRQVIVQPCHGWVEQVEAGALDCQEIRDLVAGAVTPLLRAGVDSLVLGCTHYPYLTPLIRELAGPEVAIVDTGPAIARELQRRLQGLGLLRQAAGGGTERFWVSGDPESFGVQLARLWRPGCPLERLPVGVA